MLRLDLSCNRLKVQNACSLFACTLRWRQKLPEANFKTGFCWPSGLREVWNSNGIMNYSRGGQPAACELHAAA